MTIGLIYEGYRIGELELPNLPQPGAIVDTPDGETFVIESVRTADVGEDRASALLKPFTF